MRSIVTFFTILLLGCARVELEEAKPIFMLIKSPSLNYADAGFLYIGKKRYKVQIYSSANAISSLEVTPKSVCIKGTGCLGYKEFQKRFFSYGYNDNILYAIFSASRIFDGKNLTKKSNGFTQKITHTPNYDIEYSVLNNQRTFRDRINHILIKVKGR